MSKGFFLTSVAVKTSNSTVRTEAIWVENEEELFEAAEQFMLEDIGPYSGDVSFLHTIVGGGFRGAYKTNREFVSIFYRSPMTHWIGTDVPELQQKAFQSKLFDAWKTASDKARAKHFKDEEEKGRARRRENYERLKAEFERD